MIIGFSKYGKGSASKAESYLMTIKDLTRPPIDLNGNIEYVAKIADLTPFKWKYTSGVLSFAPGEEITEAMELDIISRFEQVAFAGLDPDQYAISWVRHTHANHHELHFLTPRIEMYTEKSMNIRPPGKLAKDTYDDLRTEINAKYNLADPDDPRRARTVAVPGHLLKIKAIALRNGLEPAKDIREGLTEAIQYEIDQSEITSHQDMVDKLTEAGFTVTRKGTDYLTVRTENTTTRGIRLKGGFYGTQALITASTGTKKEAYTPLNFDDIKVKVDRHITKRAEYNNKTYVVKDPQPVEVFPDYRDQFKTRPRVNYKTEQPLRISDEEGYTNEPRAGSASHIKRIRAWIARARETTQGRIENFVQYLGVFETGLREAELNHRQSEQDYSDALRNYSDAESTLSRSGTQISKPTYRPG